MSKTSDNTNSIPQSDEYSLQSFLADAPPNPEITEAEPPDHPVVSGDDMFDLWREQMADDEWIRYMTELEYNRFCCAAEGGY